jgi:hypothetical protein
MSWVLKNEFATKNFVTVEKPSDVEHYVTVQKTGSINKNRTPKYSVLQRTVYSVLGRGVSEWHTRNDCFEKTEPEARSALRDRCGFYREGSLVSTKDDVLLV